MSKIITRIIFLCLTSIALTSRMQVIAKGCNDHINKNDKVECTEEDTNCKTNRASKYVLDQKVRS